MGLRFNSCRRKHINSLLHFVSTIIYCSSWCVSGSSTGFAVFFPLASRSKYKCRFPAQDKWDVLMLRIQSSASWPPWVHFCLLWMQLVAAALPRVCRTGCRLSFCSRASCCFCAMCFEYKPGRQVKMQGGRFTPNCH